MRLAMLLTVAIPLTVQAQVPPLATGSHLKLDFPRRESIEGVLMSQTPDSLVIAADGARITSIPSEQIGRVRATMGKSHGAGAKKGAKLGAMIGAGFGVVLGVGLMEDDEYGGSAAPALMGAVGAAEGALYGVIIGSIAGATDWKTVYEHPLRVGFKPRPGGVQFGLSVSY